MEQSKLDRRLSFKMKKKRNTKRLPIVACFKQVAMFAFRRFFPIRPFSLHTGMDKRV